MKHDREFMDVFYDTYQKIKELGGMKEARIFVLWSYLTMYKYRKAKEKQWLEVEPLQSLAKDEVVFIVRIKK